MKQKRKLSIFAIGLLAMLTLGSSTFNGVTAQTNATVEPAAEASAEPTAESAVDLTAEPATEPTETPTAEQAASVPAEPEALYPISATTKVLENDQYELYLDEATANVRVVSKATGTQWLGAPQLSRTAMPNEKKFVDSAVHIRYTEGADITQTYSLKDKETTFEVQSIEDALRIAFNFGLLRISFAIEYRLTAQGLDVTIPDDSISEQGIARLISIEALPFMNAAKETDEGAMLLPDGSGALLHFRENHPAYLKGYSEVIYGADPVFIKHSHDYIDSAWQRMLNPKESIALPVFGIYRNGVGVLGIVKEGDYDARINGTPAGVRAIKLYRASAEFLYRKDDSIIIGNSGLIPYYQGFRIPGNRTVGFVLLEGSDANYVGMAKRYRDYLMHDRSITPVIQDQPVVSVKLFGGIQREEILGHTFIPMTTFEQARTLTEALRQAGVTALELTVSGWSKNGAYGNQPEHFPVERKLGGLAGLQQLADYARNQDIVLYLSANYVRPYHDSNGMSKRKDTVRGMDREIFESYNYYPSDRWNVRSEAFYLLKPDRVYERHIEAEADQYKELGIAGIHLDYMGNLLYSDQTRGEYLERSDTAAVWRKTLDLLRAKTGRTSVDYGYAYTLGHIDRIEQAPVDSSHFIYTDETVPFYQIALHGLVPYYAAPINLLDHEVNQKLRMVEYGALPSFELTYAETNQLQRTMEDRLFSSYYEDWMDTVIDEQQKLQELYGRIAGRFIEHHEKAGQDVYKTTYDNDVEVWVNYSDAAATISGVTIEAKSYTVRGGSER